MTAPTQVPTSNPLLSGLLPAFDKEAAPANWFRFGKRGIRQALWAMKGHWTPPKPVTPPPLQPGFTRFNKNTATGGPTINNGSGQIFPNAWNHNPGAPVSSVLAPAAAAAGSSKGWFRRHPFSTGAGVVAAGGGTAYTLSPEDSDSLYMPAPTREELQNYASQINPIPATPGQNTNGIGGLIDEYGRKLFPNSSHSDVRNYAGAAGAGALGGAGAALTGGNALAGLAGGGGIALLVNHLLRNTQMGQGLSQSTGIDPAILSTIAGGLGGTALSHIGGRSRRRRDDEPRKQRPYGLS